MFKRLAAIAVPAFIIIIAALAVMDVGGAFEPPLLLPILNTLFISSMSFAVAYMSARSYLTSGSLSLLLLGCGVLAFGAANMVAGWLIDPTVGGPNVNVTIHNTGALFGSAFHAASAVLLLARAPSEKVSKHGKLKLLLAYLGVLVLTALVTMASLQGTIPTFFIQGVGPTLIRQVVLGTAVALYAISSLLFMGLYFQSKSDFLYWYSLALALVAVGLSAVFLQKAVGSPIGWAGRLAQYLGGVYFLVVVLTTIRGARTKGIPLEKTVVGFFRELKEHHRLLVETVGVFIFVITLSSVIAWYIDQYIVTPSLSFPKQRIIVGSTDNFPPFDLRDENGDHIGYARDISMSVAKELGVEIEYRTSSRWIEVVEWLQSGEVDLIHLIAYSTERDEYFDFTIPHTLVPEVIFVRSERLDIHGLDDLEGKQIGAVRRHITHEKLLKYEGLNIMVFETPREGLEALLDGKVDAFAYPEFVFEYLVQQMGREDEIKIVGEPLGHLRYGMAVREGDQVLLSYLDQAIQRIEASGKRDEIAQRWFGRKVFLGLTREDVLSLIGWAVSGVLIASLGGLAYTTVRYRLRKADAVLRHNLVFQHMDDSVILTSLGGEITDWNPGAERMFGYSREEILGQRLDFLYAPEESTELFERIIREVQEDRIWSGEIRAVRKDGSQVVCSTTVTALRNEQEDIIAYTSIIRDITERVRAEAAHERRARELETLYQSSLSFGRLQNPEAVGDVIITTLEQLLDYQRGAIVIRDESSGELRLLAHAHMGLDEEAYQAELARVQALLKRESGITRYVTEHGESVRVGDVRTDPRYINADSMTLSEMAVPLKVGGRTIGAINVESTRLDAFSEHDERLLTTLASQATIAIENARLYEQVRRHAEEQEERVAERTAELEHQYRRQAAIAEIELAINQPHELQAVLDRIAEATTRLLPASGGVSVVLWSTQAEAFIISSSTMSGWDSQAALQRVHRRGGASRWIVDHRQPLVVPDVRDDPFSVGRSSEFRIGAYVGIPLLAEGKTLGVLFASDQQPREYTQKDLDFLTTLASRAAVAITKVRLYEQAQTLAALEERQRLAHDLHDVVSQTLFSASVIAETLPRLWERDPDQVRHGLTELQSLTRGALAEMRGLLLELRPDALAETGLRDLLRQLTAALAGRSQADVSLTVEGQQLLPPDVRIAFYRIAQESLNNIAKHARAKQVAVSLTPAALEIEGAQREGVEMHIHDDGRGFDPQRILPGHLGLGIMRERAEAIGATLTVNSQPDQGTEVVVTWPGAQ